MKTFLFSLGVFFFSLNSFASVTAKDLSGTASLQVVGGRTDVKVNLTATYPSTFLVKIFYDRGSLPNCDGNPDAVVQGPNIQWSQDFSRVSMSGGLVYVTACVYNKISEGTFLIRTLSDYDYAQGID